MSRDTIIKDDVIIAPTLRLIQNSMRYPTPCCTIAYCDDTYSIKCSRGMRTGNPQQFMQGLVATELIITSHGSHVISTCRPCAAHYLRLNTSCFVCGQVAVLFTFSFAPLITIYHC